MSEILKINKLEIENVKRVKAVQMEPTKNGLTIIGGDNDQGKTSVLDAIAWALGGNRFKPSQPHREGSVLPPDIHIVMSNGLVVERKGKNSDLKVIDPNGDKAGQQLLDSFVEELALNLPKFMGQTNKEKAQTLLQIIGVGEQLYELEKQETETYNLRRTVGQIADQKAKFAKEQPYYPDAPKQPVSASELIQEQQEILTRNGENHKKRQKLEENKERLSRLNEQIERLMNDLAVAKDQATALMKDIQIGEKDVLQLQDESTAELEQNLKEIERINIEVRANQDKQRAEDEANNYKDQYDMLTAELEKIRQAKIDLLLDADLPLEGLSIEDGELTYKGQKWDNMSGSGQLKVATAIVRKLNPSCGFVLMDKLEQMDLTTLHEFGEWLKHEGLQAIATRVSKGEECSLIIEDGYVAHQTQEPKTWKAGEF